MAAITFEKLEKFGSDIDNTRDALRLEELDNKAAAYIEDDESDYAASVWYFRSNIQATLQSLTTPQSWEWRQKHRERQILYLRRAASHRSFIQLAPVSQASILTNLGNGLSSLGRGIEAIEIYDEALGIVPQFAMALGNRGRTMYGLVPSIADPGHAELIASYAHRNLKAALARGARWEAGDPDAGAYFAGIAAGIEKKIKPKKVIAANPLDAFSFGRSREEQGYRRWSLANNLFLNPLMVIGPHSIAATDRMNLPSYVSPIGDPPTFIAWFNQMKQEYVAARWFLYEGIQPAKKHFADRQVFLVNTLDYPAFGIQVEKLRASFRIAFGIFDKIAGFINAYYQLGIDPKRVDIRSVWHTKKQDIRPEFLNKPNLALRGLYWLALDIVGDDPADQDSIAPEAVELKRLRNLLEHRCLVLREMGGKSPMGVVEAEVRGDFEGHAMHLLRLARCALMYLAFSMRKEEADRRDHKDGFIMGTELPIL